MCEEPGVTAYLVSIAPEPDTGSRISIRVEATGSAVRLVEMTVRSSSPDGLSLQGLPQLDLAAVGRALLAAAGTGVTAAETGGGTPSPDNGAAPSTGAGGRTRGRRATGSRSPNSRSPKSSPAAAATRKTTRQTDRAYRRMPDVDELMAAFAEAGSVTKLAERYGVPRHTAQGWMGRARKLSGE
jgi:hypothetical protein